MVTLHLSYFGGFAVNPTPGFVTLAYNMNDCRDCIARAAYISYERFFFSYSSYSSYSFSLYPTLPKNFFSFSFFLVLFFIRRVISVHPRGARFVHRHR